MMCQPFRPSAGAAALCRKILLRRGAPSALADVFNYHQCAASAGVALPVDAARRPRERTFPIIISAPLVPASSRRPRRAVCFTSCFPLFLPSRLRLFFAARLRKCRPAARLSIFLIPPRRIYCASRRWSSAFPCGARRTARLTPLLFPAREERYCCEQRESAPARRAAAASAAARRRGFRLRRRLRLARPHDDRRVRYHAFFLVKVE